MALPELFGLQKNDSVKAWINFNGTGTVAINGNGFYNMSTPTDNGVGLYTLNFQNAMPDNDYAVVFGASVGNGRYASVYSSVLSETDSSAGMTTTSCKICYSLGATSPLDANPIMAAVIR